jgi:hypothetical protein
MPLVHPLDVRFPRLPGVFPNPKLAELVFRNRDGSKSKDMTKIFLFIVGVLLLSGLFYLGVPFIGCWYHHHRFDRYVHVQVDLPSCGETSSELNSRPCRYIFSFEGAEEPAALQFAGADLHHRYDQDKRIYIVSGVGSVSHRNNSIQIAPTSVLSNNQALPRGTQPCLVFVKNDGQLMSGYCDVSW